MTYTGMLEELEAICYALANGITPYKDAAEMLKRALGKKDPNQLRTPKEAAVDALYIMINNWPIKHQNDDKVECAELEACEGLGLAAFGSSPEIVRMGIDQALLCGCVAVTYKRPSLREGFTS